MAALTSIAEALVTPKEVPPVRLPDLSNRASDVKKLYSIVDVSVSGGPPVGGALNMNALIGGADMSPGVGFAVLRRDPVAPVIYSHEFVTSSASSAAGVSYIFLGRESDAAINNQYWVMPPPAIQLATPVRPSIVNPAIDNSYIMPSRMWNSQGAPVPTECVLRDGEDGYFWYGGGMFAFEVSHRQDDGALVVVPTGGGVKVRMMLLRYTGGGDDDELPSFDVIISAGSSVATAVYPNFLTGTGAARMLVGFYRVLVVQVTYNSGAADIQYGNVCVRVGKKYAAGNFPWAESTAATNTVGLTYHVSAPRSSPAATNFLFEDARVNAMSLLATNVTPMIVRGGDVYASTFSSRNFWNTFSLSAVAAAAGNSKYGYRGPLEKGAYTWMELPDAYAHRYRSSLFIDERQTNTSNNNVSVAFTQATPTDGQIHVVVWNAALDPATAIGTITSPIRLQLRVDWHHEFVTANQLATLSVTPYRLDDLSNATKTLALTPCFTENWIHLSELWSRIKQIGGRIAAAGGRAAASAALAEMAAGLALL